MTLDAATLSETINVAELLHFSALTLGIEGSQGDRCYSNHVRQLCCQSEQIIVELVVFL